MSNINISNVSTLDIPSLSVKNNKNFANDFSNMLKTNMDETNNLLNKSDSMVKEYATNRTMDLHEVMIAVQEAGMALSYTMQVRNKLIEAYQEVMRTQV